MPPGTLSILPWLFFVGAKISDGAETSKKGCQQSADLIWLFTNCSKIKKFSIINH
jgi:hypothetical protein